MTDDRIDELLERWEDLQRQRQEVAAEELCPDEPELWDELRLRIEALKRTRWLAQPVEEMENQLPGRTPSDFGLPEVLGRYRLEGLIGSGGFGQVWKAHDPDLHRQVAVKIPRPDRIATPRQTERFLAEARRIAQLRHPGIVAVYDVGQDEGRCFIVTDLIGDGSLSDRLEDGWLEVAQAVRITEQACEALNYAHRQNIVHRDIKPSNILIDEEGRALLADFGIAITVEELQTESAVPVGTLAYMSPEQVRDEGIDSRSDVYSLGVVLYELLTGRLPFHADDPVDLRRQIERGVAEEELFQPHDQVPLALQSICVKALATNPDARFSSAREMAEALRLASETRSGRPAKQWVLIAVALLVVVGFMAWSSRWWNTSNDPGNRSRADLPSSTKEHADKLVRPSAATTNVPILENVRRFSGHMGPVHAVAISQDGQRLASGSEDQTVRLWRLDDDNAEPTVMKQFAEVTALTFSPDGRLLSCGCSNGLVRRWHIGDGEPREIVVYSGQGAVRTLASSSDGRFLAAGGENGVSRLWRLGPQSATLATFPKANGPIVEVAFPRDGSQIVIGSGSEREKAAEVWFWRIDVGGPNPEVHPLSTSPLDGTSSVNTIAVSADGRTIAAASRSGSIAVWQAEADVIDHGRFNARFIGTFDTHTGPVTSLCLAEAGNWCFSAEAEVDGLLWQIPDLKQKARLPEDIPPVLSATRSVDGQSLITGHADGTVRTWKVPQ